MPERIPQRVVITEVVTRDGFQDEPRFVSTEDKRSLIHGLMKAGVASIEVTSFVHPKVVPQMQDAGELLSSVDRRPDVTLSALIPNLKGAERAVEAGVDEMHLVLSASESHNRANLNRSVDESLAQLLEVCDFVRRRDSTVILGAGIATSFACPFEGRVELDQLLRIVGSLVERGVVLVNLADTTGMTNPRDVRMTCEAVRDEHPDLALGLHLHNTRGMALANALAGLQAGIDRFDSSLGGIGGCPFAPGATGNVSTEDLVHMLHEMRIDTGIDLDALMRETARLPAMLGHHALESQVLRAGKSSDLHSFESVRVATAR
ncbi:MAG: hydroxymethylglutaryl-CoA lyase [Actinomycetota bacterium]